MLRPFLLRSFVLLAAITAGAATADAQPATGTPTFRTAIDLVPVTAVVRDGRGRTLRGLKAQDFVVLEHGLPRKIADFKAGDQGPVSLAILMDTSGSMRVGRQLDASRDAVEHVPHMDRCVDRRDRPVLVRRGASPSRSRSRRIRRRIRDGVGAPRWHRYNVALRCDRADRQGVGPAPLAPPGGDRGHRRHGHRRAR